jgi:protease I
MNSGKSVIQSEKVSSARGKVLLVIGDAAEVIDTIYPLMRLQEAGYQVVIAGPAERVYALVQHQRPEGWDITQETAGYLIQADIAFRAIKPGIEVLATADVIRGKRVTTVPKCRFDAEVCGATYIDAAVVVDGRLVTARGALDGWRWMREFLPLLAEATQHVDAPAVHAVPRG